MKENTGFFDPTYDEIFHKYTVSYDPPLVGDLMSAVSQPGYSSRHVLLMLFNRKASRKPFNRTSSLSLPSTAWI